MIAEFEVAGLVAEVHGSMAAVDPADWDACGTVGHPLLQHRHLRLLESCGLAAPAAGFEPRPLLLRDGGGEVVGAAPAYLKTSSRGEKGVDLGLPPAHERAVGPYYPKLQVEVPMVFTPGPRLLLRPALADGGGAGGAGEAGRVRAALLAALREFARRSGAASVQVAYMTAADQAAAVAAGFAPSEGNVFVWRRRGEARFEDFVASMHKQGRKRVRQERLGAAALGLAFERLRGAAVTPVLAPRMWAFYKATFERHGSTPYLSPAYFEALFRDMPDVVDLLVARRAADGGTPQGEDWEAVLMGMAGGRCLHAQHWGQAGDGRSGLLFEMYYREIEHAVAAGLDAVDFGDGGGHKALRGIGVEAARHALWFRDERFQALAAAAGARRRAGAAAEREAEGGKLPFRDKPARPEPVP